ncbi:MAG: hypothetical protein WAV11_01335 [Minisyncoccia bacterium]
MSLLVLKKNKMFNFFKKWKVEILTIFIIGIAVTYTALVIGNYTTLSDDGAITYRFAERISEGKGFTYNDGEYVNGASNPLYTLILGLFNLFIGNIQITGYILGVLFLVLTLIITSILLIKYQNLFSFLIYIGLITANYFILTNYFIGLEAGLTCLLISLLFLFLYSENDVGIGIVLGLLVANKLDGAVVALAFTIIYMIMKKGKFPLKISIIALITTLPIFGILYYYFGTIIPHSLLSKTIGPAHNIVSDFDNFWMIKLIFNMNSMLIYLFFISLIGLCFRRKLADFVLPIYLVIYVLAYSIVNLGDKYPWYSVPAVYVIILIVSIYGGSIVVKLLNYFRKIYEDRVQVIKPNQLVSTILIILSTLAFMLFLIYFNVTKYDWDRGLYSWEKGDLLRATAGVWLKKNVLQTELVETGWGLPAFEFKGRVYDTSGLCSDFTKWQKPVYLVRAFNPNDNIPLILSTEYYLSVTFKMDEANSYYAVYSNKESSFKDKLLVNSKFEIYKIIEASDFSFINNRQKESIKDIKIEIYP